MTNPSAAGPRDYSFQVAISICARLAEGKSLRAICSDAGMPGRATVFRWVAPHKEFCDEYTLACELRAEGDSRRIPRVLLSRSFVIKIFIFFPFPLFIILFNLSVASLRFQPVHKDLCSQVYDSGETVPALKIQYQSFGRSEPDMWSTYTNPIMNSTTSILFISVPILPLPSDGRN